MIRQGKLQKYIRKTEPHRYQWKDDQDRILKVGDSKPPAREIKTISRGQMVGGMLKSFRKAQRREINSVHLRLLLMKMPTSDEPNIVFSVRDSCGFR